MYVDQSNKTDTRKINQYNEVLSNINNLSENATFLFYNNCQTRSKFLCSPQSDLIFAVQNLATAFRISFRSENRSYSKYSGLPADQFQFVASFYDPSLPGDMDRQIVNTNDYNSSTFICVQIDGVDEPTSFSIFIQVIKIISDQVQV